MNKKQVKRRRDMKTKLMAAICMLLVSSIMMVSTTYAWFTLSTAPEVTGINTAVGANGNLEMALQPMHGDSSKITSGTADSMAVKPVTESNITWGNLVKLDNNYGLENISLYPSELNVLTGEGADAVPTIQVSPLKTPEYGADGRIAALNANTYTGVYTNSSFYETAQGTRADGSEGTIDAPVGVRAIGTVSGMSPRNLAFRQALANANTNAGVAKNVASASLNSNGSTLADVAITHALNEGSEQYTQAQVDAMQAIVDSLLGSNPDAVDGALEYIEEALKYYIAAASIAPASADDTYEDLQNTIMAASLADLKAGNVSGAVVSSDMVTWIGKLEEAVAAAELAKSKIPTTMSGGSYYTWDDVSGAMSPLININGLKINDMPVADVMADPGTVAGSIMKNGLNLTMGSGSGVYADIADFCGDYSAGIIIPELSYGTMTVPDVEANMKTAAVSPTYLESAAAALNTAFESGTGNGGSNPITDFYGYIIDLAFRTNAVDSWLKLQPTAVDRIYENGTNTNTMGHGATMSFTSADPTNFTTAAVTRLMSAIRIVFFDTDSREVITYARLDAVNNVETDANGKVTMRIYLCDKDGTAKGDDNIMELDQNTVHELSVLVYLDGNAVGNDDVAANAANSMVGSMNLQFSSSAALDPMDYSDLMSGDGGALNGNANQPTNPAGPAISDVTTGSVTGADAEDVTIKHITNGNVKALVATIDGVAEGYNGTVTIGGQTATWQTVGGLSGWVVIGAEVPTGAVDVIVATNGG